MLPALESGGVEKGTLEVGRHLVARGHRSIVIAAGGRLAPQLVAEGSEHLPWPVGAKRLATLRWVHRVRRLLAEERPDILHLRSRLPAWIGYLAWRGLPPAARPALVTTFHGFYRPGRYSAVMTFGQALIAISATVRDYILKTYPQVSPQRIVVIPRGVDPAQYPFGYQAPPPWRERWWAEFPQTRGGRLLTLPGRLTRLKGHHDFIRLVARLNAAGLDVRGVVVGGVDPRRRAYAAEIRRLAEREGEGRIVFTGHRDDVREIYAVSDVVLSLSRQPESFGRTVLEALNLGVPVAAYAHGGVGEVLGRLWPEGAIAPGDEEALFERVRGWLGQRPVLAPPQGYTLAEMLDRTLQVYTEVGGRVGI